MLFRSIELRIYNLQGELFFEIIFYYSKHVMNGKWKNEKQNKKIISNFHNLIFNQINFPLYCK